MKRIFRLGSIAFYIFYIFININYLFGKINSEEKNFKSIQKKISKRDYSPLHLTFEEEVKENYYIHTILSESELISNTKFENIEKSKKFNFPNRSYLEKKNFRKVSSLNFLPKYLGSIKLNENLKINLVEEDLICFSNFTSTIKEISSKGFIINFDLEEAKSKLCGDLFILATSHRYILQTFFKHGKHELKINDGFKSDLEKQDIEKNGVRIFIIKGVFKVSQIIEILKTYEMFFGKREKTEKEVYGFLNNVWPNNPFKLENNFKLNIKKEEIKSGDVIMLFAMSGVASLITYGTGSSLSHVAIALWEKDELFIVEITDTEGSVFDTPPPYGFRKTKFDTFIEMYHKIGYSAVLFKLKEELSNKFNIENANKFFEKYKGIQYGKQNFLYTFIGKKKYLNLFLKLLIKIFIKNRY